MKKLVISYNDEKGFYCGEFESHAFCEVLFSLVNKYKLNLGYSAGDIIGEIELFHAVKNQNQEYDIQLIEEDGSEWIYG